MKEYLKKYIYVYRRKTENYLWSKVNIIVQ